MIFGILLKILGAFLGYATKRDDNATAKAIESIRAEVEQARTQADVIKANVGNPLIRLAAGIAAIVAVLYFTAIVVDTIWQLPGDIDQLPASTAALLSVIFGGMFLKAR